MNTPVIFGMFLSALAFAFFTAFDTSVKFLAKTYTVFQIMSHECLVAAVLVVLWGTFSAPKDIKTTFKITHAKYHLVRGAMQVISNTLFFISFTHMPLTEFYVILFTIPISVMLLSAFWLHEKITPALLGALLLSFVGVLVALKPQNGMNWWALLSFAGTLFNAVGIITLRKMSKTETPTMTALMVNLTMGFSTLVPALFSYVVPNAADMGLMLLGGFFFGAGQVMISNAVKMAGATLGTVPQFLQLVYGALAGFLVFGDVPQVTVYAGGALVIAANLYLLFMQNRKMAD